MELKVWCEGIQRIICGINLETTSQDVVFALAHATGKVGRFTLIERWRNNERLLAPHENPLKILLKWGEYANDVQFILQRSDQINKEDKSQANNINNQKFPTKDKNSNMMDFSSNLLDRSKEFRKSFSSLDNKQTENIGIVKGIPQQKPFNQQVHPSPQKNDKSSRISTPDECMSTSPLSKNNNEINLADVRQSLEEKSSSSVSTVLSRQGDFLQRSNENLLDFLNFNSSPTNKFIQNQQHQAQQQQEPSISSNGALVPPPYRNPPRPRNSPLQKIDSFASNNSNSSNTSSTINSTNYNTSQSNNKKFLDYKDNMQFSLIDGLNEIEMMNDNYIQNVQYKDLVQLIKYQREKLNLQKADLTKYDAEIIYLESKERDQAQELEAISREISKVEQIFRQGSEQLQTLQYVEEENELVKQQEKTLKSEITLLRSKLANCETELLQCTNKIRMLMDEIQIEQRTLLNNRQKDNSLRQNVERTFLSEMERIQTEIDQVIQNAETSTKTTENLKKEIQLIENAISEKKKKVEQLVNEMKEVNLQSLVVSTSDETRYLLEGSNRPGSTRRIIGSPRQLENAVPAGVWV